MTAWLQIVPPLLGVAMPSLLSCRRFLRSRRTRPRGFHRAITVTIPTSDHGLPARSLARWLAMLLDCGWLLLGHPGLAQDDWLALSRVVITTFRFKSFLVCVALRFSHSLCAVVTCLVSNRRGLCQCLPALHVINPCGDESNENY